MTTSHINGTHPQLVAFLVLNVWPSHVGLPLLLAVVTFSKRVHRHPAFISMCLTWIITGASASILLWAGKTTGPEPSKMLCLLQASLLYAVPPMDAMGVFVLVIQMFLVIRSSFKHGHTSPDHPFRLFVMLAAPYILFLGFALTTAIVGAAHPEEISRHRRFFYCSVKSVSLTDWLSLFSGVITLAALIFEIWIIVILFKRYKSLRSQGLRMNSYAELSLPIRTVIFGLYVTAGTSLCFLAVSATTSPAPDLILATTGSAVVLVFGSQPDILRALCFWRRPGPIPVIPVSRAPDMPKTDMSVQPLGP